MDMFKPARVDASLFPPSSSLLEVGGDLPSPNLEILPALTPPSNPSQLPDTGLAQFQSVPEVSHPAAPLPFEDRSRSELAPPVLPLSQIQDATSDSNPYRLKKSQIGSYNPTVSTPFQTPPAPAQFNPLQSTVPPNTFIPPQVPTGSTYPQFYSPANEATVTPAPARPVYTPDPLRPVWMYKNKGSKYWSPFSKYDCSVLEQAYQCHLANGDTSGSSTAREGIRVAVEGSRFDVMLFERTRNSVFWTEEQGEVRRCTWYYKGDMDREFRPFSETHGARLEEEFQVAAKQNIWPRKINLGSDGVAILNSPFAMVQFVSEHEEYTSPFPGLHEAQGYPQVIRRGYLEWESVSEGDVGTAKHLIFVVHGIGERSNMLVSIEECVSDMRQVSNFILGCNSPGLQGLEAGRVEFLPIAWHTCLRSDFDNVDHRLNAISLSSTPKIRHFSNSALTDILFYTSPVYCQTIIDTTTSEMNRILSLYRARNPEFSGGVSLIGHSLGSCILFDLLANQTKELEPELKSPGPLSPTDGPSPSSVEEVLQCLGLQELSHTLSSQEIDLEALKMLSEEDLKELGVSMGARKKMCAYISEWRSRSHAKSEKRLLEPEGGIQGYTQIKGVCGTGQISISYPKLDFYPKHLFCIGSPIGLFLSLRGTQKLGREFFFPTCGGFYHIFHPYDYVAYRIEPLIDPDFHSDPELLPHYRGGKRLHLELRENLEKIGTDLKQKIMYGVQSAVSSFQEFAKSHTFSEGTSKLKPPSIEEIKQRRADSEPTISEPPPQFQSQLNQGKRVDYVLQLKGIETINDYLFALSSHSCYWRSEDTVLFCLAKIFSSPT